ncbi:uncharacterized protein LOC118143569 [Callithrix jacchus]|uniref:uncharacterized protein LOC118143569 n=1 Tax=Callithrix jacchus TaxID=9483 RepID=UPI0023DD00B2|nr:uncharacterized protein LOC118143569 [Callithrix jacchus]
MMNPGELYFSCKMKVNLLKGNSMTRKERRKKGKKREEATVRKGGIGRLGVLHCWVQAASAQLRLQIRAYLFSWWSRKLPLLLHVCKCLLPLAGLSLFLGPALICACTEKQSCGQARARLQPVWLCVRRGGADTPAPRHLIPLRTLGTNYHTREATALRAALHRTAGALWHEQPRCYGWRVDDGKLSTLLTLQSFVYLILTGTGTRIWDSPKGGTERAVTQTMRKHTPCFPLCGRGEREGEEKSCRPSGSADPGTLRARPMTPSLKFCGSWCLRSSWAPPCSPHADASALSGSHLRTFYGRYPQIAHHHLPTALYAMQEVPFTSCHDSEAFPVTGSPFSSLNMTAIRKIGTVREELERDGVKVLSQLDITRPP